LTILLFPDASQHLWSFYSNHWLDGTFIPKLQDKTRQSFAALP
jgi:hypothetical protein